MLKTVVRGRDVSSMQLRWKHVFGAIKLKAAYFRNQKAKTLFCELLLTIAQFNCKQIKICFPFDNAQNSVSRKFQSDAARLYQ